MGRDFKRLKIFNLSYAFLLEVYAMLPSLPDLELRNMHSQLQRAATSVVLNIVEGASMRSNKVFLNHLQYSYSSCKETEVLLMLAFDLKYIDKQLFVALHSQLDELKASLFRFMKSVDKEILFSQDNFSLN